MRLSRRRIVSLSLWPCVLLCSLWSEITLAQPGDFRRANDPPQDVVVPLTKRIDQEKTGRELFVRDWSKPESKPAGGGDGLGPMFNDVSCVACHQLGGIGGAGKEDKNVRLLHLVGGNGVPLRSAKVGERELKTRQQVHPEFVATTSVVLHRHEWNGGQRDQGYQDWMEKRLPDEVTGKPHRSPLDSATGTFRTEGLPVRVTERNTTSLFGAGLIDSIPDAAIVEQAERQKKQHAPRITGRVPQDARGAVGRFGWRGQVATLQEFVMTACSLELGLSVPGHPQSQPVLLSKDNAIRFGGKRPAVLNDLGQEECNALTAYVAGLSAPKSARAATLNQAKSIQRGEALFEKAGCAICHVPDVGAVAGLFSDLLLHDMGPNLSDPLPAVPELNEQTVPSGVGYYGPVLELVKNVTTNIHQEWRTPPLWGVASSGPYLHDGRATTLEEAIQWHGGEGQRAAEAFRALKPDERRDLLLFLGSLTAPADGPVMLPPQRFGGGLGAGGGGGGFF